MNCKWSAETLILSFKNLGWHGVRTSESSTNLQNENYCTFNPFPRRLRCIHSLLNHKIGALYTSQTLIPSLNALNKQGLLRLAIFSKNLMQ